MTKYVEDRHDSLAVLECDGLSWDEAFDWWMHLWLIGNFNSDVEWAHGAVKMLYPDDTRECGDERVY